MLSFLIPAAATILVGILGLTGVLATTRQRAADESSRRFWKRLSWALDAAVSDDPRTRATGERTLRVLADSDQCTDDDRRVIETVLAGNRRHPLLHGRD